MQMGRFQCVLRVSVDEVSARSPLRLLVRPMTVDDALRVGEWRYRDQWSVYDIGSPGVILDELDLYWAVTDPAGDTLVGFVCAGAAARVPGLDADASFIDVGVGINPGLVGQGRGSEFGEAVLDHLARRYPGRALRAVIQAWNERSLRFATRLGFIDVGESISTRQMQQVRYRVLVKHRAEAAQSLRGAKSGTWCCGDRLVLREFVAADEQAVHSFAADPLVTRFTDWGPNTIDDTRAFVAEATAQATDPQRAEFALAAVHAASDTVIGSAAIAVTSRQHQRGELGFASTVTSGHRDMPRSSPPAGAVRFRPAAAAAYQRNVPPGQPCLSAGASESRPGIRGPVAQPPVGSRCLARLSAVRHRQRRSLIGTTHSGDDGRDARLSGLNLVGG